MHAHKLSTYNQLLFSKKEFAKLLQKRNDKTVLELTAKVLSFLECPYAAMNGKKDCQFCKEFFTGVTVPCQR